jgi:linoleoyl-CoA desaturase
MVPKTDLQVYKVLKKRINNYFKETGKDRRADPGYWTKFSFLFLLMISGYIFLLGFGAKSLPWVFLGYLVYTLSTALFVVNVAHDACHNALAKKRWVNQTLGYSWNILGISKTLWEAKHHYSHHIYTNIPHKDIDIAESPFLRFSPQYLYRACYRYQFLYAPFLYFLFGIFIVYVRDFSLLFSKDFNTNLPGKKPRFLMARIVLVKLVYFTISFVIPLAVLPFAWWKIFLIYLFSMAFCGSLMLLVLVVPHINKDASFSENDFSIRNQDDWALNQINSTVDSSVNSRLLSWFAGGLNTHLVHHLFPNICHTHYRALTGVIKQALYEMGFEYKEKTFLSSITAHFQYLKQMGMPI